ncbi:hypothetical protein Gbem_2968 [Citrifermentans bemidjiense Bem]|uniref:RiboL-PSP-HEPN domain-containing protein n=1 Tax=Citrifermentans bemidjiense (strain ATCC BAA-1014 / DSM 16622 / JCM 12645 / Bem) TaxID=404380 RepID=B5EJ16_CITBB|nr:HEPN domain-containing protein [Citrifermentans bemidjiense]ACH39971.1 hypothetical protein Gbem_2968 [Citrifermentans bemidjiense Bem]
MTPVEILNEEYKCIIAFLDGSGQPSLSSDVNKYFKKVITLSSASYFEHRIQEVLVRFISQESSGNTKVVSFFKKKAITMQYHTYFDWGEKDNPNKPGKNANVFFALFGEEFKRLASEEIKKDPILEESMKAFLELGHLRNILVHSNFAAYSFDNKNTEEIFLLYQAATKFVKFIEDKLTQVVWFPS